MLTLKYLGPLPLLGTGTSRNQIHSTQNLNSLNFEPWRGFVTKLATISSVLITQLKIYPHVRHLLQKIMDVKLSTSSFGGRDSIRLQKNCRPVILNQDILLKQTTLKFQELVGPNYHPNKSVHRNQICVGATSYVKFLFTGCLDGRALYKLQNQTTVKLHFITH